MNDRKDDDSPMYNLTREERETTFNWNMESPSATIDTADPTEIRKLDKMCEAHPDIYKCISTDERFQSKMYTVADKKYVRRYGKPASAAQREAGRKNLLNRILTR